MDRMGSYCKCGALVEEDDERPCAACAENHRIAERVYMDIYEYQKRCMGLLRQEPNVERMVEFIYDALAAKDKETLAARVERDRLKGVFDEMTQLFEGEVPSISGAIMIWSRARARAEVAGG